MHLSNRIKIFWLRIIFGKYFRDRKDQILPICDPGTTELNVQNIISLRVIARNESNRAQVRQNNDDPYGSSIRLNSIHAFKNAPKKIY